MKQQMCARCGERPAVIYIQKMEGDEVKPEGLCIQCARELNIGSINQMIDKLGISDEELEQASEQMSQFMENMGDFNFGDMSGMFNSENMDGAQTMPFANLFHPDNTYFSSDFSLFYCSCNSICKALLQTKENNRCRQCTDQYT